MGEKFQLNKRVFHIIFSLIILFLLDIIYPLSAFSTETLSSVSRVVFEESINNECVQEVLKDLDLELVKSSNSVSAITNRRNCIWPLGEAKEAIVSNSRFLDLYPSDFDAHLNRGIAEESLKRWEDAEKDYQWIIERYPNETFVLYNLANVKGSLNDWLTAKTLFGKAASVRPEFAMASSSKALVSYQLGEFEDLESELRILIRRYPMFADARAALSACLSRKGLTGEAKSHWAAAIGLDARYKDQDWLLNTRRWPPTPTHDLMQFLNSKS